MKVIKYSYHLHAWTLKCPHISICTSLMHSLTLYSLIEKGLFGHFTFYIKSTNWKDPLESKFPMTQI